MKIVTFQCQCDFCHEIKTEYRSGYLYPPKVKTKGEEKSEKAKGFQIEICDRCVTEIEKKRDA